MFLNAGEHREAVSYTHLDVYKRQVLDVLDEHIDSALDRKLGGIDSEDLTNIFQGGN